MLYELERKFEYENGYMATAEPRRFSKFISHLEFFNMTSHLRGEIVELGVFKGNSLFRWVKFRDLLENTYSRKIEIIKGDILKTLPNYVKKNPQLKISLLHIDVDLYEATDLAIKLLFEKVVQGGIIVFDDYGDFAGANKAIDDFFGKKVKIKKLKYSHNIAYIIK